MADTDRQKELADKYGGGRPTGTSPEEAAKRVQKSVTSQKNIKAVAGSFSSGTPSAISNKDPLVYLGSTGGALDFGQGQGSTGVLAPGAIRTPITQTLSETQQDYFNWDQKKKDKFLSQLALAGYDVSDMKDAQAAQAWGAYAEQAGKYFNNGNGQEFTPWDVLAMDRRKREEYAKTPRSVTATSTNANLSSAGDARAMFTQAAQSLLGRDPTAAESKNFQAMLNAQERANPTVTTQTSNYIGDELQNQSSTTTGGIGEGAKTVLAMDDIKKDPEYGAFQAATNGMNWLEAAIGG